MNQRNSYRFFGVLWYPAVVRIKADTLDHATIRAHYGEYDRIEKLLTGEGKFEMDPGQVVVEVPKMERSMRYRAIFTETTSYAVEFESNLDLPALMEDDRWREELDNFNVGENICWQAENATDVIGCVLEHLEPLSGQHEKERK